MELNKVKLNLLKEVAGLEEIPLGAYNIRSDGALAGRNTTQNIDIVSKKDKPGIDIIIKADTKNERVDIPVIITESGLKDLVYNDFYIGENADVLIVAGCGIHNDGSENTGHDGIHSFHVGKNAKVKYVEKHYGEGDGNGERTLNPTTLVDIDEGGYLMMNTVQIKGVDSTLRTTKATLNDGAVLEIRENILTHGHQTATTDFTVDLNGKNSGAHIISRSVARDNSSQTYISCVNGNAECSGHTECDAIIMDNGRVSAIPKINANNVNARLVHEAAIGKIAGEQLDKLMTLGLDEKSAEDMIIEGFLG